MLLKIHQYIAISIVVFVILAVLWPLIVHAVTEDEVGVHNSPTEYTALVAATGAPEAPKRVFKRTSGVSATASDPRIAEAILAAFPDAPIMYWVAVNESGLDPSVSNPSGAKGLFEIVGSTWRGTGCTGDPFNAEDSIACARKIYDTSGTAPWNESKYKGFDGGWAKHL